MPPNLAPPQTAPTPEQSLSTLLTPEQLTELITLISAIADFMHAQLSDAFDISFNGTTTTHPHERLQKDARNPNLASAGSDHGDTEAEEGARRIQARGERDLDGEGLGELKNDALEWFQVWRDGVVGLVVDALNTKETEGKQDEVTGAKADMATPPDYEVSDPQSNTSHSDASLANLYPPTPTPLSSLPRPTRVSLLSAMLLLLLSKGLYAAPSRILLLHMTSSLHLPLHILQSDELKLAQGLLEAAKRMSADAETQKRSAENAASRRWKVGLAGVAGAALIGVTGGLAAPLVAGAIGSVMGGLGLGATAAAGLLGTLGSSGVIVGSLFGAYGYGMTSKMMDQYAKEVEDFAFLPMRARGVGNDVEDVPAEERRLRVTIGVSGWLTERGDIVNPWKVIGVQSEVFALRWELEALLDMGKSLETMVSSTVWVVASREIIARTVFASLMFAMWPIALLKLSKVVDNPFNVAKSRADKAGLVLADAIINKAQGERPVTLIGYSMGARLIYSCLMSLAERRAFGLVESAVLIGAPAPSDASVWQAIRSVVSGRLVNVYSEKDYVLAFLYRTSSIQFGVAGLEAVDSVKGVENVDASATVTGHLRYPHLVGTILENIGWEDINLQEAEREQNIVNKLDKEEEQKLAQRNEMVFAGADYSKTQVSSQGVSEKEAEIEERRPPLPIRNESNTGDDPLGADQDLTTPKDVRFEEALAVTLARYVKQEAAQKFRCRVPECQKLFKAEHFWRKHVGTRHTEWLEGIKQEVRSSAYDIGRQDREEQVAPTLPARPALKHEEEDLISFDDAPIDIEVKDEKPSLPERPRQKSILDMPEEGHDALDTHDEHQHSIEMSDDEESHGITMVDNEDERITMLEPIPWTEDQET